MCFSSKQHSDFTGGEDARLARVKFAHLALLRDCILFCLIIHLFPYFKCASSQAGLPLNIHFKIP